MTNSAMLDAMGYSSVCDIAGKTCGLRNFLFTTGLIVGLSAQWYERRYCYEHHRDAAAALLAWDGQGHPGGPWIKVKGAGVDQLNPELMA